MNVRWKKFHQPKMMCWGWRILTVLAFVNMTFALLGGRWYAGANAGIIALFSMRICALEQYVSECNQLEKECKQDDGPH